MAANVVMGREMRARVDGMISAVATGGSIGETDGWERVANGAGP